VNTTAELAPKSARSPRRKRKLPRLALDAAGLAAAVGISRRSVCTLAAAGKLPASVRLGGRVVWYLPEVRAWLKAGAPDRQTWEAVKAARAQ
jgi:predicted DNA-binding transcriptional regulator AlpA